MVYNHRIERSLKDFLLTENDLIHINLDSRIIQQHDVLKGARDNLRKIEILKSQQNEMKLIKNKLIIPKSARRKRSVQNKY